MSNKNFVVVHCGYRESIWDAVQRHQKNGNLPPNATVNAFNRAIGKQPENAIGKVTVRANESFWICVK